MGATAVVTLMPMEMKKHLGSCQGDMVKVTSADGKIEVMYDIQLECCFFKTD
jgi:formylmethanofuran dehydrogenase subunit D